MISPYYNYRNLLGLLGGGPLAPGQSLGYNRGGSDPQSLAIANRGSFSRISQTYMGLYHMDQQLTWGNAGSIATGIANLSTLPSTHRQQCHINDVFGLGQLVPWDGVGSPPDVSDPANIDFWGADKGGTEGTPWANSLDAWIQRMVTINPSSLFSLTLFQLPWWMIGRLQTDGSTVLVTEETIYDNEGIPGSSWGRCLTNKLSAALDLIEQVITRYAIAANNPYGAEVRYFSVFSEMKGWLRDKDGTPLSWDMTTYAGTAGDNADMGGLYYYNQVYDRIKSVATTLGVTLNVGGPYTVVKSMDDTSSVSERISDVNSPVHAAALELRHGRPAYGYYRKQDWKAFTDFFAGANGVDFSTMTVRLENRGSNIGTPFINGWTEFEVQDVKWHDIVLGLEYVGMPAGLPIVFMESYLSSSVEDRDSDYRAVLIATALSRIVEEGVYTPFFWSPTGNSQGNEPAAGLLTRMDVANGGNIQPFFGVYEAFAEHFSPGEYLYGIVTDSPSIEGLGSRDGVLLWNKSAVTKNIDFEGSSLQLPAYGYAVVEPTDLLTDEVVGVLGSTEAFIHEGNFILEVTMTSLPPTNPARISFRELGTQWWEIRVSPLTIVLFENTGAGFVAYGSASIASGDLITIIANGTSIDIYLNHQLVIDEVVVNSYEANTVGKVKTLQGAVFSDLITLPYAAS